MNEAKFEKLKKLLALKRHEQPPPGYFDRLPNQILAAIESEQRAPQPWLQRFWLTLQAKPAFAGAFGLATCLLVVGGVFVANRSGQIQADNAGTARPALGAPVASGSSEISPAPVVLADLSSTERSSTNPLVSNKGLENFFNGSLVSSGAFPNVEGTLPVNVPVGPR